MGIYFSIIGIGVSIVGIAVLVVRALPRIRSLASVAEVPRIGVSEMGRRFFERARLRQWQALFMGALARVLHRLRIGTLKTDNHLSQWLERIKDRSRLVSARSRSWILDRSLRRKTRPQISFAELAQGQWKAKEDELLNQIKENPREAGLYLQLAELYEKMGNVEDATEARLAAEKLAANPPLKKVREISKVA